MHVHIDTAGQNQEPVRIDLLGARHLPAELRDPPSLDADIRDAVRPRSNNPPAANDQIECIQRNPILNA
jgi:hypothetical protein